MYSAPITRRRKALFVLIVDRSGSMDEKIVFSGIETTKAKAVAQTANMLIDEIVNRSRRNEGVADYCDIAVVGYSGNDTEPLIGGSYIRSVVSLAMQPYRMEKCIRRRTLPDGRETESVIERKYWFDAAAAGSTPLGKALATAEHIVRRWVKHHPTSFPPMVINITDGEASDADNDEIETASERIKAVATDDGATLLVNIHIASVDDAAEESIKYPAEGEPLPDNRSARLMYRCSSTLPDIYNSMIAELKGTAYAPPYKAVCYNASADELLTLLGIGSVTADKII